MKRSRMIQELMMRQQTRCCRSPNIEIVQAKALSPVRIGTFRCKTCRCTGKYCVRNGKTEIMFTEQESIPRELWAAVMYLRRDIRGGSMQLISGWIAE